MHEFFITALNYFVPTRKINTQIKITDIDGFIKGPVSFNLSKILVSEMKIFENLMI